MKTIAIDFDGVIHAYSKGWQDGTIYDPPVAGAFDAIRRLQRAGFAVVIFSARDAEQIAEWCAEKAPDIQFRPLSPDLKFWSHPGIVGISNTKIAAEIYIDDRALPFQGDWNATLAQTYCRLRLADEFNALIQRVDPGLMNDMARCRGADRDECLDCHRRRALGGCENIAPSTLTPCPSRIA